MAKAKACSWRALCRSKLLLLLVAVQVLLICGFFALNAVLPPQDVCQRPKHTEAFELVEEELSRVGFRVVATCAAGYVGKAKVMPCSLPHHKYRLTGCVKPTETKVSVSHGAHGQASAFQTGPPATHHLELKLPEKLRSSKKMQEHGPMFKQYGFNLKKSNELGLVRASRDLRNEQCQARSYEDLPQASVIIIFFNEALSTLLRNVMMVLNLSPPHLLGEVLLVDDHSDLEELELLPEHLERLAQDVGKEKVRLLRRKSHDGIVAARNLGAKEARFPVIIVLDSHAEVTVGWLEPLLARIKEDRKRVVVPNIVAIDINTLEFLGGVAWPPVRGIFNWRLTFIGTSADLDVDLLEKDVGKKASAWRSPVMPGGLFAMDRDYYWELGGYDPEIRYYGAEHVEMSFRIWMCGGSLEVMPCSNIGHIYREFDRFGVDRQLHTDIGKVLDNNDARVAEVWMDDYKELFFKYRHMKKEADRGPGLKERQKLRDDLHCKSFSWFLEEICRDLYIPDEDTEIGQLLAITAAACVTGGQNERGSLNLQGCKGSAEQQLEFTSKNYIQLSAHVNHHLVCLRTQMLAQVPCAEGKRWTLRGAEIHSLDRPGDCLTRSGSGEDLDLVKCKGLSLQRWLFENPGTLSGPDKDLCVDNMQRTSGPPGLYGCHGGNTQRWHLDAEAKLRSGEGSGICLGLKPSVALAPCVADDDALRWLRKTSNGQKSVGYQTFSPWLSPTKCLESNAKKVVLGNCSSNERWFKFPYNPR